VTARSLLGVLLACLAVFGCSFGAARLASQDQEPTRARSAPPPAAPTAQPSVRTLALDAAPGLPGLRERPRPKPKPKLTAAAAPTEPAAPAPDYTPAPSTASPPTQPAPAPAPEPAPVTPQAPAPAPAPSPGETTTFYDGG
jgi:hypothetical protein